MAATTVTAAITRWLSDRTSWFQLLQRSAAKHYQASMAASSVNHRHYVALGAAYQRREEYWLACRTGGGVRHPTSRHQRVEITRELLARLSNISQRR
jgi:hypothetical protein